MKHVKIVQIFVSTTKARKFKFKFKPPRNEKIISRLSFPISLVPTFESRDEILFKGGRFVTPQILGCLKIKKLKDPKIGVNKKLYFPTYVLLALFVFMW